MREGVDGRGEQQEHEDLGIVWVREGVDGRGEQQENEDLGKVCEDLRGREGGRADGERVYSAAASMPQPGSRPRRYLSVSFCVSFHGPAGLSASASGAAGMCVRARARVPGGVCICMHACVYRAGP